MLRVPATITYLTKEISNVLSNSQEGDDLKAAGAWQKGGSGDKRRPRMLIDDVTAILLISPDAKGLCEFYKATLGFPLEEETHDGMPLHYGYSLGDVHFAIHPANGWTGDHATPRAPTLPSAPPI